MSHRHILHLSGKARHQFISHCDYYKKEALNGNDLNKTFHKSWKKIKDSSRYELFLEQITHYISTYGSNFQAEVYIPSEELNIPEKLTYKVVKSYPEKELIKKCFDLLISGLALKEETINDLDKATIDIKALSPQLKIIIDNQINFNTEIDLLKSLILKKNKRSVLK